MMSTGFVPDHVGGKTLCSLAMVEEGDHTVSETARTLGLARQSVQRTADLLEADGLVRYVDNPRHRRARLIRLTREGRAVLGRIQAAQRPLADELGAGVGEARLRRLSADLDRVVAGVELRQTAERAPRRRRSLSRHLSQTVVSDSRHRPPRFARPRRCAGTGPFRASTAGFRSQTRRMANAGSTARELRRPGVGRDCKRLAALDRA